MLVLSNQVGGDALGVVGRQCSQPWHLYRNQATVAFHERGTAREKIKSLIFSAARNIATNKIGVGGTTSRLGAVPVATADMLLLGTRTDRVGKR